MKHILCVSLLLVASNAVNAMDSNFLYLNELEEIPASVAQELENYDENSAWQEAEKQAPLMQAIRNNSLDAVDTALYNGAKVDRYAIELVIQSKASLDTAIVTALAFHRSCSWNVKKDFMKAFPAIAELLR